jgi:hypothetical protein
MKRLLTAFSACVAVAVITYSAVTHWLAWRFGMGISPVPQGTGWPYQLESGFVPALTVLSLLTAIIGTYHLHNCHKDGCWRIGKHKINGTPWCSRHEGDARPEVSVEHLLEALIERLDLLAERLAAPEAQVTVTPPSEPVPGIWDWLRSEIHRRGGGGTGSVQRALGQTWQRGQS